ncbi:MAG: hypothetical protein NTX97_14265 [Bacteroidetes bacterium]|nr:hypothetical protein [Bacteroidota bacterium]
MKKSILLLAFAFCATGVYAQDLTSKKGEPILPEAGDWAISMDANPIFNFIGNAFKSDTTNSAPGTNWLNNNQTIIGKKFIDEKSAYRILFRIGFTSETSKMMVLDESKVGSPILFPVQPAQTEDKFSTRNTNIAIGLGKEMRRGKTRLQGFYGADAMVWISASGTKAKYGNIMSSSSVSSTTGSTTTTNPTSTDWYDADGDGNTTEALTNNERIVQKKSGMTFGIGVRGFIGAEYFLFPKMSIGAEYGWGIGYQTTGKGRVTTEKQGGTPNAVAKIDEVTAGSSKFGFDTDINQKTIFGMRG